MSLPAVEEVCWGALGDKVEKWVGTRWPFEGLIGHFSNTTPLACVFDRSLPCYGYPLTLASPERVDRVFTLTSGYSH